MADGAVHIDEPGILDAKSEDVDLKRYLAMYDEADEAQSDARGKAERDRDYVDNKQLTQEEVDKLTKRGQPPVVLNLIRSRASFLGGMEKKQRRDPKAFPRNNPSDVEAAEAFTDGMRYVVERADYASKRSQAWKNITIEGYGGVEWAAVQGRDGVWKFTASRIPWDRLFYDPHSAEPDFSDSNYQGQVLWLDYDEAVRRAVDGGILDAVDAARVIDDTCKTAPKSGETYEDKPRNMWADKRRRVRIVMMWVKEEAGWVYVEFTKAGIFRRDDQPYVDQDGESYCPLIIESANIDRENNRYGEMRHLIDPQDEVNKRRQKALHLVNTRGVIADDDAVDDVNAARRELAKPDYWLKKQRGSTLEVKEGADLAAGQAMLGQQAMQYILEAGPNGALLGKGVSDQSGRAIEAQQAGGLVEQSDLMDTLRRFDLRSFTMIASMMKQFWDAKMWVRVTDDDETPRWVGFNLPMWTEVETGETAPENVWEERHNAGEPFGELQPAVNENGEPQLHNEVARLDMDILVSDAPDTINMDGENYQAFVQLMGMGLPPAALKIAIEMNPGLPAKRKKQLIDMIDQMANEPKPPAAEDAERIARETAEANVGKIRSETYKNLTAGEKAMAEVRGVDPMDTNQPPRPDVMEAMQDQPPPPMAPPGPAAGPPAPRMGSPDPMQPPQAGPPSAPPPAQAGPGPGPAPMTGGMRMVA